VNWVLASYRPNDLRDQWVFTDLLPLITRTWEDSE